MNAGEAIARVLPATQGELTARYIPQPIPATAT